MESSENIGQCGRRLAADMRAIRSARDISADAVIRATKAAPNVVEEFETTALVDNPMYNRVYLRLFVRSYAEVLGIRADDALSGVEEVLAGTYSGSLRRTYLEPGVDPDADPGSHSGSPDAKESGAAGAEVSGAAGVDVSGAAGADVSGAAGVDVSGAAGVGGRGGKPAGGRRGKPADIRGARSDVHQPSESATGPAVSTPASLSSPVIPAARVSRRGGLAAGAGTPSVLLPGSRDMRRWAGAAVGALILIVAMVILWPSDPEVPVPAPVVADTLTVPEPVLPPRIVLGDTTLFSIIAARDTLNPIRVTAAAAYLEGRWMDLNSPRTPVWVEFQDTLSVKALETLILERFADDVDVLVHGIRVPTRTRDARGALILSKQMVQAYLDSLRSVGALPGA